MTKKILVYGLSHEEKTKLIDEGLTLYEIHEGNAQSTLQELVDGVDVPYDGDHLALARIMIFSGFEPDDDLKELISKIRREHVFGAIMALTTKTNLSWRFCDMISHLFEEREDNVQMEKERRANAKAEMG